MKFQKKELTLEKGLQKEWLITNGIGGFSSQTILGANTRKYHGLLIAPLMPPGRRFLILSKVDESIQIQDRKYNLYTNVCKDYISDGYQHLESFEKEYIPIFTYQIEDVTIKKLICMEYGKNTVCILYKIHTGKNESKITLAPLVNFRDFHCMNSNHTYTLQQEIKDRKVKIIVDNNAQTPFYMNISEGQYIPHQKDTFKNMYYMEEEKRGFYPEEDHAVVGRYEITLAPEEEKEVSFVFSLEENIDEIDTKEVIDEEIIRLNEIVYDTGLIDTKKSIVKQTKQEIRENEITRDYIIAADNFIVDRPNFGLHTIIAGYPWFLDWGRDSLIAFEGLLLTTKRYDLAREVLLTFIRDVKFGLVPNGYSGFDNRPLYNSVDASLLLFEQIKKFLRYTNDTAFIKKKMYKTLIAIIKAYLKGIDLDDNNIHVDEDGLLSSGTETTQNTWMDAKYENFAVTPRNGKAVEINAMWYNALRIMEELAVFYEDKKAAQTYKELAEKVKISFTEKFYCPQKKYLYDVLGDSKLRPNQLFALSLSYPVIEPNSEIATSMLEAINKKLLTKYGLRTLAKGEKDYVDVYEGDGFKRDMSYHQGITWPWLLGIYYDSLKNRVKVEKDKTKKKEFENQLKEFVIQLKKTYDVSFYEDDCVGSISELYDSKPPYLAKGSFAQAWSISEVLRILTDGREKGII